MEQTARDSRQELPSGLEMLVIFLIIILVIICLIWGFNSMIGWIFGYGIFGFLFELVATAIWALLISLFPTFIAYCIGNTVVMNNDPFAGFKWARITLVGLLSVLILAHLVESCRLAPIKREFYQAVETQEYSKETKGGPIDQLVAKRNRQNKRDGFITVKWPAWYAPTYDGGIGITSTFYLWLPWTMRDVPEPEPKNEDDAT